MMNSRHLKTNFNSQVPVAPELAQLNVYYYDVYFVFFARGYGP